MFKNLWTWLYFVNVQEYVEDVAQLSHLVSRLEAVCSISSVTSSSSPSLQKYAWTTDRSSSRLEAGMLLLALRRARAADRTRLRSESSNILTPSSQPCGAENSSASCCFRKPSYTFDAAWQEVHSSRMSWELWSFISAGKWRLYSCGTMFFLTERWQRIYWDCKEQRLLCMYMLDIRLIFRVLKFCQK